MNQWSFFKYIFLRVLIYLETMATLCSVSWWSLFSLWIKQCNHSGQFGDLFVKIIFGYFTQKVNTPSLPYGLCLLGRLWFLLVLWVPKQRETTKIVSMFFGKKTKDDRKWHVLVFKISYFLSWRTLITTVTLRPRFSCLTLKFNENVHFNTLISSYTIIINYIHCIHKVFRDSY